MGIEQDGGVGVVRGGEEVLVGIAEETGVVPNNSALVVGAYLDHVLPGDVEAVAASGGVGVAAAEDQAVDLVRHCAHCVVVEA